MVDIEWAKDLFETYVSWKKTGSPLYPYEVCLKNRLRARIRVNNDPEFCLYTLEVGGTEIAHFDSVPLNWELEE